MSYNTNDIMGYAQDPIVFSNEQGGNELYEKFKVAGVWHKRKWFASYNV